MQDNGPSLSCRSDNDKINFQAPSPPDGADGLTFAEIPDFPDYCVFFTAQTGGLRSGSLETYTLEVSLLLGGNFLMCVCFFAWNGALHGTYIHITQ